MSQWNDGGVPYGTRKVRFYASSASDASGCTQWTVDKGIYILEGFSPTRGQFTNKRYSEGRVPNGAFGVDDFVEGSCLVQLAYDATPQIDTGMAFQTTRKGASGAGASEAYVVINVEEPESQGDIRKQPIRIQKLVATPSGNLPPVYP